MAQRTTASKTKLKPKPDDLEQYKRFLEAAKNAEADESEEGADHAFRKVVPPKRNVPKRD